MAQEKIIGGKSYEDIEIGADPELRFENLKARPYVSYEGKFGTDGPNSQVGELRPTQFYDPVNLTKEIEAVMRDGYRKYPILQKRRWLAGSYPDSQPIGGHIHFGSNGKIDLEKKLKALDMYLAPVVMMLEDKEAAQHRRQGTEYGKLALHNGKVDPKNRGFKTKDLYSSNSHPLSHDGFEYRPLPSWLVSKQITLGVLSLAKVIGFQAHNKSLHKYLDKQMQFIPFDKKFSEAFTNCDKRYFAAIIPTIFRTIASFKLYPEYKKYINYLFSLIYQNRTWEENSDIKDRWQIVPTINQTKKVNGPRLLKFSEAWEVALSQEDFTGVDESDSQSSFLVGD